MPSEMEAQSQNQPSEAARWAVPGVRVELHCHSVLSDGALAPEALAERLAAADVEYAALTDHDTLAGLPAFRQALARHGIGFITGTELTTLHEQRVVHLLAYGFDPRHPGWNAVLPAHNEMQDPATALAPPRRPTSAEAIAVIHKAGGLAILAHPSLTEPDPERLRRLVESLREEGLDGVEAFYGPATPVMRAALLAMAADAGLQTSAGTDYHAPNDFGPGLEMPVEHWKAFRDALLRAGTLAEPIAPPDTARHDPVAPRVRWRSFALNIVLPAGLALTMFTGTIFMVLLPYFEQTLTDRKRDTIRELTQAAWGVLQEAADEVAAGQASLEQAQALAMVRIRSMRYGPEGKDYFWLQDLTPRMIMHPYRQDLDGQDVSEFRDPRGARIFVEFADLVRARGEGYISYVWQWKDDEDRLEPKESYIRLFAPWEWIVGTGIYVHDVQAEIARLRRHLVHVALGISAAVLLLMLYLVRQGLRLERQRGDAERRLRESTDRYRALTEAATEGALFVHGGRCQYANPVMLELAGCAADHLELLDLDDLFPDVEANAAWRAILRHPERVHAPATVTGVLERRDHTRLGCALTLRPVLEGSPSDFMVLVRRNAENTLSAGVHATLHRLLELPATFAADLNNSIGRAAQASDVAALCRQAPELARALLQNGAAVTTVTRVLSSVTDAATCRLLALALAELGPPPVPYAFLAMGSQGRQSQTLFTDQDNALMYATPPDAADEPAVNAYFLAMGARVCDGLDLAGYRHCKGGSMASNPRWCRPLPAWQRIFTDWIRRAEPRQLMEFSIFFDFRAVAGAPELARELRVHIAAELRAAPHFFPQAAQNALHFKPPLRVFGSLVGTGDKEHTGRVDVKAATMPIIAFARLYALREDVRETGTIERLAALARLGVLLDSKRQEIVAAYEALLRLRLHHQAAAIEQGRAPDNWIDPRLIGHIEEAVLRECYKEIDALQTRIQRDFLGG